MHEHDASGHSYKQRSIRMTVTLQMSIRWSLIVSYGCIVSLYRVLDVFSKAAGGEAGTLDFFCTKGLKRFRRHQQRPVDLSILSGFPNLPTLGYVFTNFRAEIR